MDTRLWILCGLFALWGLAYLIIGVTKKVTYQVMTGIAVILLAASMPMLAEPRFIGWVLVAVALPLGVAALVMRFAALFGRRERR